MLEGDASGWGSVLSDFSASTPTKVMQGSASFSKTRAECDGPSVIIQRVTEQQPEQKVKVLTAIVPSAASASPLAALRDFQHPSARPLSHQ